MKEIRLDFSRVDFNSIFLDRDGDGLVDTIDLQIHLASSCGKPQILSAILNLCAAVGFESIGTDLPIVTHRMSKDLSFGHHLYIGLEYELNVIDKVNDTTTYFLTGNDDCKLTKTVQDFTLNMLSNGIMSKKKFRQGLFRGKGFNLLNPFSIEGFYRTSRRNPLKICFPYRILLFSQFNAESAAGAANFATRLGLESLHLPLPLAFSHSENPDIQKPFIYIGKKEDLGRLKIERVSDLFPSKWDSGVFLIPSTRDIPDVLICGEEKGIEKILRYLSILPADSKGAKDSIFIETNRLIEDLKRSLKTSSRPSPSIKKIVRNYHIEDERKEVLKTLREGLKKISSLSGPIEIEIFLIKPEVERRRLAGEVSKLLRKMGFSAEKVRLRVLNAYKPGLSWMREVVLKEIVKKRVDRVEIAFQPFKAKGLEEPIRWLQEIYPIDEIFAKKLGIPKERIEFKKEVRLKEVYRVRGWRRGKKVYEALFSPRWKTMDYLMPFPRKGKVHPCRSWIGLKRGGREVISQGIKSGVEQIWEIYQKEILPLIAKEADSILLNKNFTSQPQIFKELRFEIFLNYPMEKLEVDEERISPLEALHEEIYFVTLDFFFNYLKCKGISNRSIGPILPLIYPNHSKRNGKFIFTLTHSPEGISLEYRELKVLLNGFAFRGSDVLIDLGIEPEGRESLEWLGKLIRSSQDSVKSRFKIERIFEVKKPLRRLRLIARASDLKNQNTFKNRKRRRPLDIPMERPIGYREGLGLIHSFEGLSGVNIVHEGTSSGGLSIYSIEHTSPCLSRFVSHLKRVALKPTFFINCRHHANEVSSTNAGLRLSYLFSTQPHFQRLLKKVNVVINPMENVDGVVLLEEMLKWTPKDKLHAGRYNRAGREYYSEYFNPNTPFGEARVKPDIWKRWLPDICVDNHGFPSHEWNQPFSGYAPFQFREWWIPQTFFFLYLPFLEEEEGTSRRIRSEKVGKWVWTSLLKKKAIGKWNRTFSERYWKYREQWISPHLTLNRRRGWLPLQKRFRQTNYSYCYPHITAIDFITEVADEITEGRLLRSAITAHLETNLSIIRWLNSLHFLVIKKGHIGRQGGHVIWWRERALNLK